MLCAVRFHLRPDQAVKCSLNMGCSVAHGASTTNRAAMHNLWIRECSATVRACARVRTRRDTLYHQLPRHHQPEAGHTHMNISTARDGRAVVERRTARFYLSISGVTTAATKTHIYFWREQRRCSLCNCVFRCCFFCVCVCLYVNALCVNAVTYAFAFTYACALVCVCVTKFRTFKYI